MDELWFTIFWLMVAAYAILDGRNIGAGSLHFVVAKTLPERRQLVAAIGPLWSWDEVWLIASGGVLLSVFPSVLAAAFSGYYLALFLILWSLILRGIAMEVGGHMENPLWQSFWNFVLAMASILLAVLFGVALGNIVRGDPLDANGEFHLAFFTNFGVRGNVGLLDWFTVSMGVFSLIALSAHGATFLAMKCEGAICERSKRTAKKLWMWAGVAGIVVFVETCFVRPDLFGAFVHRPLAWVFLAVAICGVTAIFIGVESGRERRAFAGSCAAIGGILAMRAAVAFPVLLYSTLDARNSLTAYKASVGHEGLSIAIVWWSIAMVLCFASYLFVLTQFRGRVKESGPNQSS